jgi:hypothetical protein
VIRDPEAMRRFENEEIRTRPADLASNLRLFEAMWTFACSMGRWPPADPLEGIENDIYLAEALHVRRPSRAHRDGTRPPGNPVHGDRGAGGPGPR